jgi:hypothetical protein
VDLSEGGGSLVLSCRRAERRTTQTGILICLWCVLAEANVIKAQHLNPTGRVVFCCRGERDQHRHEVLVSHGVLNFNSSCCSAAEAKVIDAGKVKSMLELLALEAGFLVEPKVKVRTIMMMVVVVVMMMMMMTTMMMMMTTMMMMMMVVVMMMMILLTFLDDQLTGRAGGHEGRGRADGTGRDPPQGAGRDRWERSRHAPELLSQGKGVRFLSLF